MKKIALFAAVSGVVLVSESALGETTFYYGVGGGLRFDRDSVETVSTGKKDSDRENRLFATLLLGSSKISSSNPVIYSGEVMVDLSKTSYNKFSGSAVPGVTDVKSKHNGIQPSFGFRIGHINENGRVIFIKIGLTHAKVALTYNKTNEAGEPENGKVTVSKLVPLIAAGFETPCFSEYSVRTDIEYITKANKTGYDGTYRFTKKGSFAVKVLFVHKLISF